MTNTILSALVNGAIAAALLAVAVRFGLMLVPRAILGAAPRYGIWWTILVSTLLLPLISSRAAGLYDPSPLVSAPPDAVHSNSKRSGVRASPAQQAFSSRTRLIFASPD